jgi:hypothetical protein
MCAKAFARTLRYSLMSMVQKSNANVPISIATNACVKFMSLASFEGHLATFEVLLEDMYLMTRKNTSCYHQSCAKKRPGGSSYGQAWHAFESDENPRNTERYTASDDSPCVC